jgi:thymidylate synthase
LLIHIDDMRAGYQKILGHVVLRGRHVAPRGKQTLELPSTTIHLTDPTACIATGISRGFSLKFAYAEAIQLLGGFSDVSQFCDWFPQMKAFLDDGVMHGAYGPRIRHQLPNALDRLASDPDTRQAVVQIWEKDKDLMGRQNLHDYPCTLSLQFLIRAGALELHTTMRSNDVWLGTPYDIFQFCFLQLNVAELLHVGVGDYYHHANSLHAYMSDMSGILKVQHAAISDDVSQLQPLGITVRAHQQWVCEQIWHGNDATLSTDGARVACKALHG